MPSTNQNRKKPRTQTAKPTKPDDDPAAKPTKSSDDPADKIGPPGAVYPHKWMERWLNAAPQYMDVIETCEKTRTSLVKYFNGRVESAVFDASCRIYEQIIDLKILERIRSESTAANSAALGLYFKQVRLPAFMPSFPSWVAPPPEPPKTRMPKEITDAMLRAGLEAHEQLEAARKDPAALSFAVAVGDGGGGDGDAKR
jgi:hypothetical protein